MRRAAALSAVLVAVAPAGVALAAEQRATLPDIEDEVMCLECGTALSLSKAPVAERERAFIRREIRKGRTKEQIMDELVDRFGPAVLAMPEDEGFGLTAYLVPPLVLLLAGALVFLAARRWRRSPHSGTSAPPEIDPGDERRLERELAAYDGGPPRAPPP